MCVGSQELKNSVMELSDDYARNTWQAALSDIDTYFGRSITNCALPELFVECTTILLQVHLELAVFIVHVCFFGTHPQE